MIHMVLQHLHMQELEGWRMQMSRWAVLRASWKWHICGSGKVSISTSTSSNITLGHSWATQRTRRKLPPLREVHLTNQSIAAERESLAVMAGNGEHNEDLEQGTTSSGPEKNTDVAAELLAEAADFQSALQWKESK